MTMQSKQLLRVLMVALLFATLLSSLQVARADCWSSSINITTPGPVLVTSRYTKVLVSGTAYKICLAGQPPVSSQTTLSHSWSLVSSPQPGAAVYWETHPGDNPGHTFASFTPTELGDYVVQLKESSNPNYAGLSDKLTIRVVDNPNPPVGWLREPGSGLAKGPLAAANFEDRIYISPVPYESI